MKKSILNTVIAAIVLVFSSVNFCAANDFAYNTISENNQVVTKYIYKVEANKYLIQFRKYNLSYDAEGRVATKVLEEWNKKQQQWDKKQVYNYSYDNNVCSITLTSFENNQETDKNLYVYQLTGNQLISSEIYLWDNTNINWNIEENVLNSKTLAAK